MLPSSFYACISRKMAFSSDTNFVLMSINRNDGINVFFASRGGILLHKHLFCEFFYEAGLAYSYVTKNAYLQNIKGNSNSNTTLHSNAEPTINTNNAEPIKLTQTTNTEPAQWDTLVTLVSIATSPTFSCLGGGWNLGPLQEATYSKDLRISSSEVYLPRTLFFMRSIASWYQSHLTLNSAHVSCTFLTPHGLGVLKQKRKN